MTMMEKMTRKTATATELLFAADEMTRAALTFDDNEEVRQRLLRLSVKLAFLADATEKRANKGKATR